MLDACRSLVGISAWSVDAVAEQVDLVELRILVVLANRGASSLKELAERSRLHLTRTSRACERLVGKQLITRRDDPEDRRVAQLGLTAAGEAVVGEVTDARRKAIAPVLAAMSVSRRTELVRSLRAFSRASGDVDSSDVAALAWSD